MNVVKLTKELLKELCDPGHLFLRVVHHSPVLFQWMNDENYLNLCFRITMGRKLNLENPRTFNEKLQWLKLNNREDIFTTIVDKYEVKQYIAERIGTEYI